MAGRSLTGRARWGAHAVGAAHGAAVPALAVQARGAARPEADARGTHGRGAMAATAAGAAHIKRASHAWPAATWRTAAITPLHIAVVQAGWHLQALVLICEQPVPSVRSATTHQAK